MRNPLKRHFGQGNLHFLTFSCYQRIPFFATSRARNVFVKHLDRVRKRKKFLLPGFVVMPEHERLVVISSDGIVSLAALCWLADQGASFVMLERDGEVLVTTGPVRSSDARLRRAQALAMNSEVGLQIAIDLMDEKLKGQELIAKEKLCNPAIADEIGKALRT